jgi:hypothetical protein
MKILHLLVLCGMAIVLSGCTVAFSRQGYKLPPGPPSAEVMKRPIVIKANMQYNTNDVEVLGYIHSHDTGFALSGDEGYVLGIFCEDGRILGADVVNITQEKQPSLWGSAVYRARAQFLRFKDRAMVQNLVSDPQYSQDLIGARSEESGEQFEKLTEVTSESERISMFTGGNVVAEGAANGAIQGAVYGVIGALACPPVSDLTQKDLHAIAAGTAFGGEIGALIAYSAAERNSPIEKLKKDAFNGDLNAQLMLGLDYDFGTGVNQNYSEAARWYQLAANRGNPIAQNNLGRFFQYGVGGKSTDYHQAMTLYQQSADQGFPPAQCNIGYMYDLGLGVPTNKVEAITWYRDAAQQGYPEAMMNLGICYRDGNGIAREPLTAYMWIDCANFLVEKSPDDQVKSRIHDTLEDLKSHLTLDQIKQGDVLANQWFDNFQKAHP